MRFLIRLSITITLIIFTVAKISAQEVRNIRAVLNDEVIEITFDLEGEEETTYDLTLYSSLDTFFNPLMLVEGDVGKEISPGQGKKILWRVHDELGDTKGEVTLQLRGIPTPPFLQVLTPQAGDKVRRGKPMEVRWSGNAPGQVELTLEKDGKVVATSGPVPNNGSYDWPLDSDLATEKGYQLVFTSSVNNKKTVKSGVFAIQPKVALGLKVLPILVVGSVVGILISGQSEPESKSPAAQGISLPIGPGG